MSDKMLCGILRAPVDPECFASVLQLQSSAQQAADRIEHLLAERQESRRFKTLRERDELKARVAELEAALDCKIDTGHGKILVRELSAVKRLLENNDE
jgi:hypothetical protein